MSQRGDPFAYTELQNIVDNGHYLNLSKARAHFGIEPLTDTVKELKLLQEAFIDLCLKIAGILVRYRKYYNALNEIQPYSRSSSYCRPHNLFSSSSSLQVRYIDTLNHSN